jgi:ActD protein
MPPLVPALPPGEVFGVLAEFKSPQDLNRACERVRDAGYTRWDAHTPLPLHGIEGAMGIRMSKLPFVVLVFGLGGAGGGMLLQWWVASRAYPLVISGKPFFSWQAFIPITFELGVLSAAAAALIGMLAFNRLPMLHHPLFDSPRFERASDDRFFISIESWDPKYDERGTSDFLRSLGAVHVEVVRRSR